MFLATKNNLLDLSRILGSTTFCRSGKGHPLATINILLGRFQQINWQGNSFLAQPRSQMIFQCQFLVLTISRRVSKNRNVALLEVHRMSQKGAGCDLNLFFVFQKFQHCNFPNVNNAIQLPRSVCPAGRAGPSQQLETSQAMPFIRLISPHGKVRDTIGQNWCNNRAVLVLVCCGGQESTLVLLLV